MKTFLNLATEAARRLSALLAHPECPTVVWQYHAALADELLPYGLTLPEVPDIDGLSAARKQRAAPAQTAQRIGDLFFSCGEALAVVAEHPDCQDALYNAVAAFVSDIETSLPDDECTRSRKRLAFEAANMLPSALCSLLSVERSNAHFA